MKVSILIPVTLITAGQLAGAIPVASPAPDNVTEPEFPKQFEHMVGLLGRVEPEDLVSRHVHGKRDLEDHIVNGVPWGKDPKNPAINLYDCGGKYARYRQEFRKFETDQSGRVLDLLMCGFDRVYKKRWNPNGMSNWKDRSATFNSYPIVAGIHGLPFTGWWGHDTSTGNPNSGYCTHGSTLFPTWHRPYIALFEEVLFGNAWECTNTIKDITTRRLYQNTMKTNFRLPYWDWAENSALPGSFTKDWHSFNSVTGWGTIRNPLKTYNFPDNLNNNWFRGYARFDRWANTVRDPSGNDDNRSDPQGNINAVQNTLRGNAANLRQSISQLLLGRNSWASFSNNVAGVGSPNSLEGIHGSIHVWVGGNGGHMAVVPFASFDPVFWFHHCNIDRLFAIWQAINPSTWVTGQRNGGGTYGVQANAWEDKNTPLYPFKGANGQFHTSDSVRDTSSFCYGYPETPKWNYKGRDADYQRFVKTQVSRLYGGSFSASAKRKRDGDSESIDKGIENSIIDSNKITEYRVDVITDKTALGGSYSIAFFLGRPSPRPADWATQPEYVGSYSVFTTSMAMTPPPGIDPATINNNITGTVPLTDALVKAFARSNLTSSKREDAIPFLEKNLRWRAVDSEGNAVRVRNIKGLFVAVSTSLTTLPTEETPWEEYGEWTHLADIVRKIGRDGGPDKVGVVPSPSVSPVSTTEAAISTEAPATTVVSEDQTTATDLSTSASEASASPTVA
ncbi:hypothetical protein DRE_01226 [Drechslerella stenobrocha 248]|uniref:tyrosinase n=1 Tax=Drechslerella stenobrocha 248 TaxID=1043628 RepID=W7I6I3_9PEZI|nr:hypothetical protein DRE_01226 [Drechslerella stenobrocha 248]